MDGNYSELMREARDGSRTVLQRRTRQRLAEAAMKEHQPGRQLTEEGEVCGEERERQ